MDRDILIVEDEAAQAQILKYNLESAGFSVIHAASGEDGLHQTQDKLPALILLDWMLPDMSGIEICRKLKSNPETKSIPVIMLTARGSEDDKVRGLTVGADDYVVKPYSIKELIARIQTNLRRIGELAEQLSYGDISMNLETHRVTRDAQAIKLGPTEYRLMKTLLSRPQKVWTRSQLLDRVWGTDIYVDERTVDVHMGRLRKALNGNGRKDMIRTIRGAGYSLDSDS